MAVAPVVPIEVIVFCFVFILTLFALTIHFGIKLYKHYTKKVCKHVFVSEYYCAHKVDDGLYRGDLTIRYCSKCPHRELTFSYARHHGAKYWRPRKYQYRMRFNKLFPVIGEK